MNVEIVGDKKFMMHMVNEGLDEMRVFKELKDDATRDLAEEDDVRWMMLT
jgi:hypothetical protein